MSLVGCRPVAVDIVVQAAEGQRDVDYPERIDRPLSSKACGELFVVFHLGVVEVAGELSDPLFRRDGGVVSGGMADGADVIDVVRIAIQAGETVHLGFHRDFGLAHREALRGCGYSVDPGDAFALVVVRLARLEGEMHTAVGVGPEMESR